MDNSPTASRSPINIPPPKLSDIEINKLVFPGVYDYNPNGEHAEETKKTISKIYDYDPNHFIYIDIIESSRHIVKEVHYHNVPLLVKMAVKSIRISTNRYDHDRDEKIRRLTQEITTFRTLSHHPNVVDFYGLCFNNGEAMICMELMEMSLYDLYLIVHDKNGVFPEKILGYIAIQIFEALGFCKSKNLIHRDVKPKNILLNSNGEVKLCDFGESRILKGVKIDAFHILSITNLDSLASTFVGTIAYWPPERFSSSNEIEKGNFKYDVRSDIWSLGITLAETAFGSLPFLDENGQPIMRDNNRQENIITIQHCIMNTKPEELIQRCFGETYSSDFIDFVNLCLEKLEKRPKFDKLRETEFYSRFVQKGNVKKEDMANFIKLYEEDDVLTDAA